MSMFEVSQSRVLVPLLQFPAQRKSIGLHISALSSACRDPLRLYICKVASFARLVVLRMCRRDTKSQDLEYMGQR